MQADQIAMSDQDQPYNASTETTNNPFDAMYRDGEAPSDDGLIASNDILEAWADQEQDAGPFDDDTLQALEWSKITDYFAGLCKTQWGQRYASRLPFAATRHEAQREYDQLAEAMELLQERGEEMPIHRISDLRGAFLRLQKGGHLDAPTLLEVANLLEILTNLRRFLHERKEDFPNLWERGDLIDTCGHLRKELVAAIARGGSLRNDASWELGAMREKVHSCHEGIRRKVQSYLSGKESRYLTDNYYTIRQDRYVLPVKASDQSHLPGIVYGSSGSGATVFIEPNELVARNNALRIAESDVSAEEVRILRKLSRLVSKHRPTLEAGLMILRDLDLVGARVRMATQLEATVPDLLPPNAQTSLQLKKARHPLLLLKGVDVVANDLVLDAARRCLVISGPNTGGKTVALKTMGICALLARAALPIPAESGSCVPFFNAVFTDIGDRQSLEHDLSTFSAQILKLQSIMENATEDTLVLIDEIVVGTDPEQGHALATAILETLSDAGSFVAVTTHYPQLKALPHDDERFANASVGFNLETLSPTYRVFLGSPGGSSALAIARRLGMSKDLTQRAEALLNPDADRFEKVLSRLEQQYDELYEERERAGKARRQVEREKLALVKQQEELDHLREKLLEREETEWRNSMRQARQSLRDATKSLQKQTTKPDWSAVREVEAQIQAAEAKATVAMEEAIPAESRKPPPKAAAVKVGQKVYIRTMRTKGEVIELPGNDEQVLVRIGTLRMRVALSDLEAGGRSLGEPKAAKKPKQSNHTPKQPKPAAKKASGNKRGKGKSGTDEAGEDEKWASLPTSENQCDLRGMRVEEAIDTAEAFLDQAFQHELHAVYLIHGHGTGVLRTAIREFCRHSTYIKRYRPGERNEGGNGVTAVLLDF